MAASATTTHTALLSTAPAPRPPLQLAESEQQYAEIYDEYEKAREFYAGIEAATHAAQQVGAAARQQRCSVSAGAPLLISLLPHTLPLTAKGGKQN